MTSIVEPPVADGRLFAWVRVNAYAGPNPLCPQIIRSPGVGAKLDIVGKPHLMKPSEYDLAINVLALIYPAPVLKPE